MTVWTSFLNQFMAHYTVWNLGRNIIYLHRAIKPRIINGRMDSKVFEEPPLSQYVDDEYFLLSNSVLDFFFLCCAAQYAKLPKAATIT